MEMRSDNQIVQDIRDTLAWDVRVDDDNLVVEARNGEATLSGTVRTFSEKAVAVEDAWKIKGVRAVTDRITVSPELLRLDADIATDIYNALRGDGRLGASRLAVRVSGSVVELSGSVASLAEREAAEEDAWFTAGVVDVANYIQVSPTQARSDAEIVDDIRTALLRDARIGDPDGITATSRDGRVVLRGVVRSPEERRAAAENARFTAGVVEVRDDLQLLGPGREKAA